MTFLRWTKYSYISEYYVDWFTLILEKRESFKKKYLYIYAYIKNSLIISNGI